MIISYVSVYTHGYYSPKVCDIYPLQMTYSPRGLTLPKATATFTQHLPLKLRTNAWITRNRRMAREHERLAETSEALIYVLMIRLGLRRLART